MSQTRNQELERAPARAESSEKELLHRLVEWARPRNDISAERLKSAYPMSSDEKATWLVENYLSGQDLTRQPQV